MVNPVSIALSGLNAASTRVATAASNIANAQTTDYAPIDVVSISEADSTGEPQGVRTQTVERTSPNVDLASELIDVKAAANAYKANAAVIRTASDMERELLDSFDEEA